MKVPQNDERENLAEEEASDDDSEGKVSQKFDTTILYEESEEKLPIE